MWTRIILKCPHLVHNTSRSRKFKSIFNYGLYDEWWNRIEGSRNITKDIYCIFLLRAGAGTGISGSYFYKKLFILRAVDRERAGLINQNKVPNA